MGPLERLAFLPPELVWGLVSRGIGLTFFISFASLSVEIVAIAGEKGVIPVARSLPLIRRHFPTYKRFFYFPTLLWLGASDAALRALTWVGMLASLVIVVGGPATPWAMGAAYLIYLALDRAVVLVYPWDCVLFEAGLFGVLLPATHFLPDVHAIAAPIPAVAWVYRLLIFRVMLGFGKHKFVGITPLDFGYLKGFFVNQPLPTPVGWFLQKLPMPFLKASLGFMFLAEIPLPFTVFWPGAWSAVGGISVIVLMLAIWGSGTFGYFNIAMIAIAPSWFDSETALAFSWAHPLSHGHALVSAIVVVHTWAAILSFPFNTFCAQTWMLFPIWQRIRPRFLTWPVTFIRALHPFRAVHAYGVFPPKPPPALRVAIVMEESWDEKEWFPIRHFVSITEETSRPKLCAPRHRRLDQAAVYEPLGLAEINVLRGLTGRFDPYGHGPLTGSSMLMRAILEGTIWKTPLYDSTRDEERGAPLAARVRTYMLEPTTVDELRASGKWWKKTQIGPHLPPRKRGDRVWDHPVCPPELWHAEDILWIWRSRMGDLMRRAAAGEDPHALVTIDADGFTSDDVERFWNDFVPRVTARNRHDWTGIRRTVDEIRAAYDRRELYAFERIAGRYGLFAFAKLEPLTTDAGLAPIFGKKQATLNVKSNYHLRLFGHHLVADGRGAYGRAMREPLSVKDSLDRMTMQSGHFFQVLFRYEMLVFQSQKLRLLDVYVNHGGRPEPTEKQKAAVAKIEAGVRRVWGALDAADFLKTQFTTDEDVLDVPENWPRFRLHADGSVERLPLAKATRN